MTMENFGIAASLTEGFPATRVARSAAQTGMGPTRSFPRHAHSEPAASSADGPAGRQEESAVRPEPIAPPTVAAPQEPLLPPGWRRMARPAANPGSHLHNAHARSSNQASPAV